AIGDKAVRYGGDEFVILLPGDTGDRASSMSRIILKKMNTGLIKQITEYADEDVVIPEDKKLSGSIGIAISDDGKRENLAAALARADAALYEIKRNGKSGYLVGEK
ncbi:MAG: diguanylate cyclase domain-containing protein, partial [Lachnospiraceae bacterium]